MTDYPAQQRVVSDPSRKELPWINAIKGAALLWILCSHFVEATLGCPFMANPTADWPPFVVRIAQLIPLHGHGIFDIPLNLVRYFGWLGDQGVGLFIIISGFGLAWGLLYRQGLQPVNVHNFYSRRALRIYPLWWATHLLFIAMWVLIGKGLSPFSKMTWLSFLGIRCTPGLFYYFSPAWWYIGLLIQLYLVFPLLWKAVVRWGAVKVFLAACLIGCASRAIGFLYAGDFIDKWSMGAFFVTRLPEFCFGILLASWFFSNGPGVDRRIRSWRFAVAIIGVYLLANGLSLTWAGMVVAPALLGIAGFFLLYNLFVSIKSEGHTSRSFLWFGRHSYSIFLVHHPFIKFLVNDRANNAVSLALVITTSIVLTIIISLLLEKITQWFTRGLMDKFREKKII
jgi:peptidoglycan/LPS O-acetylase OafA/YrhL